MDHVRVGDDVLGEQFAPGILIPKFRSSRNTISRKSIDSALEFPWRVASLVTSSSSTPQGIDQRGLDLLEDLVVCRH